ncbi:MAG: hypothetical protein ACRD4L_09555 [Pyrinomonadaceae bacterium]
MQRLVLSKLFRALKERQKESLRVFNAGNLVNLYQTLRVWLPSGRRFAAKNKFKTASK